MQITDSLFLACCQCPFKAFLKSKGEVGKVRDYEAIQTEADARFREQAVERLMATHAGGIILRDPPSLKVRIEEGAGLILGATINPPWTVSTRSRFSNGSPFVVRTARRSMCRSVLLTRTS